MRRLLIASLALIVAACNAAPPPSAKVETEEQKTLYALGYAVADNLKPFTLTAAELDVVKQGFTDGVLQNKATVEPQEYFPKIRELQTVRMAAAATKMKEEGKVFLDKAAAEKGAEKLASGLIIQTIKEGTGAAPTAADTVKVHYHGTLPNGKVFDSSVDRKEPATFPLGGVIPCWTEGVQKIKVGGKAKLVCPPELAYGDRAPPEIGPGATLIFEVELLDIEKPAK
jgi:FKBP-type peptidyl-prolyl cis-trans isomerase FkpA